MPNMSIMTIMQIMLIGLITSIKSTRPSNSYRSESPFQPLPCPNTYYNSSSASAGDIMNYDGDGDNEN